MFIYQVSIIADLRFLRLSRLAYQPRKTNKRPSQLQMQW